jgi:hypothetical protein
MWNDALTQVTDVSMFHTVYLTGGTDGTENFGDLWLLKGACARDNKARRHTVTAVATWSLIRLLIADNFIIASHRACLVRPCTQGATCSRAWWSC